MGRLTAIVLGAAAGGGFPQWNCACAVCRLAWAGDRRVTPRTQAGLALSGDGRQWILINASPDLRTQLQATPALHPGTAPRHSPIAAVVLTGAEVDQTVGLLTLRERHPLTVHATGETLHTLATNSIFQALAPDIVAREKIALGAAFTLPGGVAAELFSVPGKVPLYLEGNQADLHRDDGTNVGVEFVAGGARLLYLPGVASITPAVMTRLERADIVLFDGTLFTDDEMIKASTGTKTGRRMGHMPIDGADGSLAALAHLRTRRVYTHINNTNPILVDGSPERRKVEAAGWNVAYDGLQIEL